MLRNDIAGFLGPAVETMSRVPACIRGRSLLRACGGSIGLLGRTALRDAAARGFGGQLGPNPFPPQTPQRRSHALWPGALQKIGRKRASN